LDAFSQAICVRVCDKAPIQPLLCRPKPPRKAERPFNRPHIASQDAARLDRGKNRSKARGLATVRLRAAEYASERLAQAPHCGRSPTCKGIAATCQRPFADSGPPGMPPRSAPRASPHNGRTPFSAADLFFRRETHSAVDAPLGRRAESCFTILHALHNRPPQCQVCYLQRPGQQALPAKAFCPPAAYPRPVFCAKLPA